jgi:pimeloyl-ACP methyl ester carboxylesterase
VTAGGIGLRRLRRWSILLAVAILAGLAISWVLGSAMTRATPSPVAQAIAPARDVTLRTDDGVTIAATYRPGTRPGGPAVLLLHGNGASRDAVAPMAEWLAAQGFASLAIDFRGHGQSSARSHSFGYDESIDADAAFRWLRREQQGGKVALIGISLGGAAALIGPAGPVPADAMVLQAVYPDIRHAIRNRIAAVAGIVPATLLEPLLSYQARPRFGVWPGSLSPIAALATYRGPVLVIGGEGDRYTPPAETRALLATAPGPKQLWLAPGMDHAAVSDIATPGYRAVVLSFLARTIGKPDPA